MALEPNTTVTGESHCTFAWNDFHTPRAEYDFIVLRISRTTQSTQASKSIVRANSQPSLTTLPKVVPLSRRPVYNKRRTPHGSEVNLHAHANNSRALGTSTHRPSCDNRHYNTFIHGSRRFPTAPATVLHKLVEDHRSSANPTALSCTTSQLRC